MHATKISTYWLILISVALLLVFSGILYLQLHHSRLLNSTVQYNESNVSWNVFQLQSEALRFNNALHMALMDPTAVDRDQLQLRHDIFFSRTDTLSFNKATDRLLGDTTYGSTLTDVYAFFSSIDPYFGATQGKRLDSDAIARILLQLEPIQSGLNDLSLASIHQSGIHAERRASEVQQQITFSTNLIWFQLILTLLFFLIVIRQIRQLQTSRAQLNDLASFDPLTKLPNRRLFRDRLEQEVKKAHRSNGHLALMFLDLDNFKDINDTLGHDVGDQLLKEAAQRLAHCIRDSDTVARLGGDEFTIILGGLDRNNKTAQISELILQSLSRPFELKGCKGYVSASIGITFYPDDATDVNTLIKNADQAMYVAKTKGRNRVHYFTASMQEAAQAKMHLINDLRSALANNEFRLHYQPIVDMATGTIQKAEALIRWQHPVRGQIPPLEFIQVAEQSGFITEIGNWVFQTATEQALRWRKMHNSNFQISINTSPLQLRSEGNSLQSWLDSLQSLSLPGQAVAIEITESLLMDSSFDDRLLAIHAMGIEVSLDDFGTGYSSMSYLKKFAIDYLKIDRSFVANLKPGSSDLVICEAMIVMAHKLGIKVIAEGIETTLQRDLLNSMGCDYGQGYLISHPLTASAFEKQLETHTRPRFLLDRG